MKKRKKLTPKQRNFADLYILNGCNGSQAARDAGYTDNKNGAIRVIAHTLLKNPLIKQYIRDSIDNETLISKQETLNVLEKCIKGEYREPFLKTQTRVKAAEILCKLHYKMDKDENDGKATVIINTNVPDKQPESESEKYLKELGFELDDG
jgi:phage terminase small subunit